MHRIALAIAILFQLAACSQEPVQKEGPRRGPIADFGLPPPPQPGQYRVTMKVSKVEFPGMTGAMSERAKTMFGTTAQTSEYCLTAADAAKGREEYYRQTLTKGDCRYEKRSIGFDRIDAVLVCQTGKGMTARNDISGTFTAVRSELTIKSLSQVQGGEISMEAEVSSERIGDCT